MAALLNTSGEWIEEYYDSIKDQHPTLSLEKCKEICRAPFKLLKQKMQDPFLPEIRFDYLGTFKVNPFYAHHMLKALELKYIHNATEEDANEYLENEKLRTQLKNFLARDPYVPKSRIKKEAQIHSPQYQQKIQEYEEAGLTQIIEDFTRKQEERDRPHDPFDLPLFGG